jgi:hypothetical protein
MDSEAKVVKERFRKYSPELSLLLWGVWDPIGAGVPLDEYESYVPVIWKLLDEQAGIEAISTALAQIEEERMETGRGTSRYAAERLTEWWYWRFDFPEEFKANS